jgi:hypothetical protein
MDIRALKLHVYIIALNFTWPSETYPPLLKLVATKGKAEKLIKNPLFYKACLP